MRGSALFLVSLPVSPPRFSEDVLMFCPGNTTTAGTFSALDFGGKKKLVQAQGFKTVFVRKTPKNEEIRTFAQFAIALGKPMKKE